MVDIDEGTVEANRDEADENKDCPIPQLPSEVVHIFKSKWSELKMQVDLIETKQ